MTIRLTTKSKKIINDFSRKGPAQFKKGLKKSIFKISNDIRAKGSQLAPYDTGTLRRSIIADFSKGGLRGSVGSNVPYARIHDQGGTIKAHEILPKRGKFLRFTANGVEVFAKKVRKPSRKVLPYRGKGYLTPAFNEQANGKAEKTIIKFVKKQFE